MHVVFVEPAFPRNQREFVRGLREAGALVSAIGEAPLAALDDELKHWLVSYEQVGSVCDEGAMLRTVRALQSRRPVHRLEATVEAHIMVAARVREACGIPGTSVQTAHLCRDKPAMKEALRAAGIPCAQSIGTDSVDELRRFVKEIGYPVILKPRSAAGAAGTFRADNDGELDLAIRDTALDRGASVAVEEFIEGHEGFYDTICVEGRVVHEFISHYYPGVLEAMRARWISPQVVCTNRTDAEGYQEVKQLGARVIRELGIGTSATHMEWFSGPKGLFFSEIGCRPPGVRVWDLYGAGNDLDLYVEWAKAVVHGRTDSSCSRSWATGMIALRPEADGRISAYEGLDEMRASFGEWIIDQHLPAPGTPTQPVEGGYMANAWVRMRHPDYDELRRMLEFVGRTVKVHAR